VWSTYLGRVPLDLGTRDFTHQVIENPRDPGNEMSWQLGRRLSYVCAIAKDLFIIKEIVQFSSFS
jgi:hypothetical protein